MLLQAKNVLGARDFVEVAIVGPDPDMAPATFAPKALIAWFLS
jgi:hypothetical protein